MRCRHLQLLGQYSWGQFRHRDQIPILVATSRSLQKAVRRDESAEVVLLQGISCRSIPRVNHPLCAQDLRESGDIGSFGHNLRRVLSRFWKCYIARRGYREGAWGFLIALCAALYPILSYLKARLESE